MNINASTSVHTNNRTSTWQHQDKQKNTSDSNRNSAAHHSTSTNQSVKATYRHPQASFANKRLDAEGLRNVQRMSERAHASLKALVRNLLKQQGIHYKEAVSLLDEDEAADVITIGDVSPNVVEGAEQDDWGVEATAGRIINFAKSLAGDDPSKIAELKDAVIQGFAEAERILGGLPQVSQDTYDEVMRLFDEWEVEHN